MRGLVVGVVVIALWASSGCSWIMVAGPPTAAISTGAPGSTMPLDQPLDCSREKFAPIVDTVFASLFGFGTAIAVPAGAILVTSSDDWNRMYGGMLIGAGVVYAALATPFYFSARRGYRDVAACRRAHELRDIHIGLRAATFQAVAPGAQRELSQP